MGAGKTSITSSFISVHLVKRNGKQLAAVRILMTPQYIDDIYIYIDSRLVFKCLLGGHGKRNRMVFHFVLALHAQRCVEV